MSIHRVKVLSCGDLVFFNEQNHVLKVESTQKTSTKNPNDNILINHFKRHQKIYVTSAMMLASVAYPLTAMAAGDSSDVGGKSLIILLQKASFWVGMGITIWGIVEAMLEFPGWKGRIIKGIVGYIGILLVPLVFIEIQNSLQVDVWAKLGGATP